VLIASSGVSAVAVLGALVWALDSNRRGNQS